MTISSILNSSSRARARALVICLVIIAGLNAYFFSRYRPGDLSLEKITCSSRSDKNIFLVYTKPRQALNIAFDAPVFPQAAHDTLVFYPGAVKVRNFRLYIGAQMDTASLGPITLHYSTHAETLPLSAFKKNGISTKAAKGSSFTIFSSGLNGYFELRQDRVTMHELVMAECIIVLLSVLLAWFILSVFTAQLLAQFMPLQVLAVSVFMASIFLPQPVFNIAFIVSFAIIVKDFSFRQFVAHKAGLLFVAYFSVYFFNDLFVSAQYNPAIIETLLPVLLLPFYLAAAPKAGYLKIFPLGAALLGLYFFAAALLNAVVYSNAGYFSFDHFTQYLHPVYFSYLLFFSMAYLELSGHLQPVKKYLLPVLLVALLCCGSKLIICLALAFYAIRLLKKRAYAGYAFIACIVVAALLFKPTRNRFADILNMNSLSVLSENPVKARHDERLNGLTLRLIIWQESMRAGAKDILLGAGVDKAADEKLQQRLEARGLETGHTRYDPHNQFIATLYRTGLPGLAILLLICIYYCYLAIAKKNTLLLYTVILFSAAMFTESVLQRVTGIYFFVAVLLLQSALINNTPHDLENSDTGNQGHPQ